MSICVFWCSVVNDISIPHNFMIFYEDKLIWQPDKEEEENKRMWSLNFLYDERKTYVMIFGKVENKEVL